MSSASPHILPAGDCFEVITVMRVLVVLASIILYSCYDSHAGTYRLDMQKGLKSGLALGYLAGSAIELFPFETAPQMQRLVLDNNLGPCPICPGWFSSDGRFITWQFTWPYWKPSEPSLQVTTVKGEPIAGWSGQLNTIYALSLSPDHSRVVLEARNYFPGAENTGLQCVILGTGKRLVIDSQPHEREADSSNSVGWSPDSNRIVFSRNGRVVLLNIESGERLAIVDGSNPAWSPDGRWISFTSADSRALLFDLSTRRQIVLFGGRKITGTIAWSPDSCCVSFSKQENRLEQVLTLSVSKLIVYRIKDGHWFTLSYFGPKGGESTNFGWFYGYKALIEANRLKESRK